MNIADNIELAPHTLRRCFATYNAISGMPLPVLQKVLGHSRISTTALYIKDSDLSNLVGPLSNLYIEDEYWLKGSAISDSKEIVLKSLNNSQNVTADFLQEITCNKLVNTDLEIKEEGKEISRQCKPVLDAEKKKLCKRLSELYKQYKEQSREIEPEESEKVKQDLFSEFCRQNNYEEDNYFYGTKKSRDEFDELLYPTNINKTYQTHSQAIYTSRLLDFPNLSQPQNNLSQE
ncbi:15109_t:CDS:2 [Entrophospora sp. SA101]|nr:15109_t:CDS:2 [Entrophospora sp. SA101]